MYEVSSAYEESKRRGYREGVTIATYEIVESMVRQLFPENYEQVKYGLRWLSEYEANNLINELMKHLKNPDFSVVRKHLWIPRTSNQ